MSTQWCDFSEFQRVIDDTYPHPVAAFRSNDGTYRDRHFAANHAWCKAAVDRGKLAFFIVYAVYEPDGGNWVSTLMSMVGTPHPGMVVMIDVESWGGRISGDHSADINAGRARLAQWLGNSRRVIGYGNVGDLNRLWPSKGDAQVVVAAYGSSPSYPNKIAHQYTSSASCAPFGSPVDMNSADGLDVPTLMGALGLSPDVTGGGAQPFNPQPTLEEDQDMYAIQLSDTDDSGVIIAPGVPPTSRTRQVFQAVCGAYGITPRTIAQWQYDTAIREQWADATSVATATAAAVVKAAAPMSDADRTALAAAVVAAMPAPTTVTGDLPATVVDAIATAVRAKITAEPLTAAPFGIS